ncbi:hypothetical protein AB0M95_32940 [Sphaerisporangium sp. NPDC051017]
MRAAQAHRGREPRFMSQTPVLLREPLRTDRPDGAYSPLETAVRHGLAA